MELMSQIVKNRWFTLVDFLFVLLGGVVWMLVPEFGLWSILIALTPWMLRMIAGTFPFRRTSFDWLMAIFLITAWTGYWASYDKTAAWNKVWLIFIAVLLYYSLAAQAKENLVWISGVFFCLGVGVSIYFFLTHDFVSLPRKLEFVNGIGRWIMENRPQVTWTPIHPNYVAGVVAITTPFVFHPVWKLGKNTKASVVLTYSFLGVGLAIALFAFIMATSRGAVMAVASAVGIWLLWRIISVSRINLQLGREAFFSSLTLFFLVIVVIFLYIGPAKSGSAIAGQDQFGTGSRAELFSRSTYFLAAFPFTGGGLDSFPGLYSQYILDVPFYHVPNSHNVFLEVFIEQGLFGGLSFLIIYIGGLWITARSVMKDTPLEDRIFSWLVLFALVIAFVHGMVDDYLYYKNGTMLAFFLIGVSLTHSPIKIQPDKEKNIKHKVMTTSAVFVVFAIFCIVNMNTIRSEWYANLGAVEMAQVELNGFPLNEWAGDKFISQLGMAESTLLSSLQLDSRNRTANYRLGLISLAHRDFSSALNYLLTAYHQAPQHRGIIKSLGYCYVWLGDMDNARLLLKNIPESKSELEVYVWWWGTQGRDDLSKNAAVMSFELETASTQP